MPTTPFTVDEIATYTGIDSLLPIISRLCESPEFMARCNETQDGTRTAYNQTREAWVSCAWWPSAVARVVRAWAAWSSMDERTRDLAEPFGGMLFVGDMVRTPGRNEPLDFALVGQAFRDLIECGFLPGEVRCDHVHGGGWTNPCLFPELMPASVVLA